MSRRLLNKLNTNTHVSTESFTQDNEEIINIMKEE